jgi:hypothetical protein
MTRSSGIRRLQKTDDGEHFCSKSESGNLNNSLDDSLASIDHSKELVRSAHLLNLAKRLQLPSLGRLIIRKVVKGHSSYDPGAFLAFAHAILGYSGLDFEGEDSEGQDHAIGVAMGIKGLLEEWVIKFLAENVPQFCGKGSPDAGVFWKVMRIKGVELRVLETRAQLSRLYPGGRIKVED